MHAPTQLLNQLAFIHDAVKSVHHFVLLQPTRVTLITINFIGLSGQARLRTLLKIFLLTLLNRIWTDWLKVGCPTVGLLKTKKILFLKTAGFLSEMEFFFIKHHLFVYKRYMTDQNLEGLTQKIWLPRPSEVQN